VRQKGRTLPHTLIVLGVLPNQLEHNRIALIAGRSVGGAVQRNLAKRRMRSAYQTIQNHLLDGYDLVMIGRKPIITSDYPLLLDAIKSLFQRAGLMKELEN